MNRFASIVAGLSLAFVGTSITIAATINVNPGESIQAAIYAASDGDTIQLVQGLYTESNINVNSTVTIQGTVVDGDPVTIVQRLTDGQPVFVISNGNATLRGLQILPVSGTYGTGISITSGSPTIVNCYISGHTGSGISCTNDNATISTPWITDCTIHDNSGNNGGGIGCFEGSSPNINNCTISDNTAGSNGGGIYCGHTSPTIIACTITGNTAPNGGGIACDTGNPDIRICTISNNTGGGISYNNSNGGIIDCTISGNTAGDGSGGGLYLVGSDAIACNPNITNCTISDNTAGSDGGGIECWYNSSPTLTDCHITDNRVTGSFAFGGGGFSASGGDGADPHLINCTITGNTNWVGLPANIAGVANGTDYGGRGEQIDLGRIIFEDSTVCGTGEHNIWGVLIEHRGENHISDCIDDGDVNGDGDVDTNDLAQLRSSLGVCPHDTDMDGDTDIEDLLNVVAGWGTTCP